MKDRVILHCDMNGFFASVELLEHPELKDKPMAVCGNPNQRHGIILAKNELAKQAGVVTAETVWQALKKCPDLRFVPPNMKKYKHYSHLINKIYERFTDMVEPFSIDESWLDVTASQSLFGSGKEIADKIRQTVKSELGMTLSAGVSFNKIFAKMGSEYKKPDATTVITRENYKEMLWKLPARDMFFVGRATSEKLAKIGIKTIGDIALSDPKMLVNLLGKQGQILWEYTNGLDTSPVACAGEEEKIKSVGNGVTFTRDLISQDDLVTAVTSLADTVAGRLRKYGMKAFGVKVDIKDPYFKVISRQKQLFAPTNLAEDISRSALEIIRSSWHVGNPIRLITITAINLTDETADEQMSIFTADNEAHIRGEKIERTMDEVRKKYGSSSIGFAAVLDNDIGAYVRDYDDSENQLTRNEKDNSDWNTFHKKEE